MNSTYLWLWLYFLVPTLRQSHENLVKNQERISLDLDKTSCLPGDTIWWKGYIMDNHLPASPSTVLYLDLFNDTGGFVQTVKFPVIKGLSMGQVILPDSLRPGNYFLRATTAYQYSLDPGASYSVPINVNDPDRYQRQSQYLLINPEKDTSYRIDAGIHVTSLQTGNGLQCDIRGNNLFNKWGKQLTLRLRSGSEEPQYSPLTLEKERPQILQQR